jgi:predicted permease
MPRLPFRPGLALSLALRGLVRDPASSLVALTILALGLAAPATFFSILVGSVRPLPVPDGDRIVRVDVVQPAGAGRALPVTAEDLDGLRGAAGLVDLGGFQVGEGTVVDRERAAARVSGAGVTPPLFRQRGGPPQLGRVPSAEEAATTFLIGHTLWHELYGGDPGALGRVVEVDGSTRTIVGIMPQGFGFPFKQNAWSLARPDAPGTFELVGRLAPSATVEEVATELAPRWLRRDVLREPEVRGGQVTVQPYTGGRGEGGEVVAFVGLVLVGLCLLLIACSNVANLLLVRATERVRALAVQAALGAGRGQIAAQLFLESLLVAAAGGGAGLALASLVVNAAQKSLAEEHFGYFWMRLAIDGQVLLFVGLLVVGTALVAGLLPVVRVVRVDVQRVLKEEGGASGIGGGGGWSRAFVTLQLSLSCAALVAAGLTGQSLAGSRDYGAGVPSEELLVASLDPRDPATGALEPGRLDVLEDRLRALPGVEAAALARGVPGYGEAFSALEVEGGVEGTPSGRPGVTWSGVSPGLFEALDLAVLSGRGILAGDGAEDVRVAVVNPSFVRRYSASTPVVGRRLRLAAVDPTAWFTVVGVVEDVDMGGGERARGDRVYVPLRQLPASEVMAVVRRRGDVGVLAPELRQAVASVSPDMAVWGVRTLADAHAFMIRIPRALALMALVGGAVGLVVAAVGLYGLLAFRVRQRRRELGVRMAVGADGRRLAGEVLLLAARQLAPAVVMGLALAWLAAPVLGAFLLSVDPRSPVVFAGVAVAFMGTGMVAALVPALRASGVDPARVLRGE